MNEQNRLNGHRLCYFSADWKFMVSLFQWTVICFVRNINEFNWWILLLRILRQMSIDSTRKTFTWDEWILLWILRIFVPTRWEKRNDKLLSVKTAHALLALHQCAPCCPCKRCACDEDEVKQNRKKNRKKKPIPASVELLPFNVHLFSFFYIFSSFSPLS